MRVNFIRCRAPLWTLLRELSIQYSRPRRRKKKKGRASDTTEQWLLRASVVVGIRFLLAGDLAEEATYKVVQKHKKGLAHLLRPGLS